MDDEKEINRLFSYLATGFNYDLPPSRPSPLVRLVSTTLSLNAPDLEAAYPLAAPTAAPPTIISASGGRSASAATVPAPANNPSKTGAVLSNSHPIPAPSAPSALSPI